MAVSKTLNEIQGDACDSILVTLSVVGFPAVGASLLRGLEQGWLPVMGIHVALLATVVITTLLRRRLSLTVRAAVLVAVPYIVALTGLLAYGRGNGVAMFFITSCTLASCFFGRRIALAVVGLSVAALAAVYAGHRLGVIDLQNGSVYDMTPLSWFSLGLALIAAGAPPVIVLQALLQSLEAERKRADEAVKVRTDFLGNMSHELRSPMAGLIGMADALKGTRLDDQQQGIVGNLLRSGHNLLAVLNGLLDFSKFESTQVQIEKLPFRISQSIQDACAMFETRAAQKGIRLGCEFVEPFSDHVFGDPFRLGQVLTNLIDNAVKFTAQGSVVVRAETTPAANNSVMLTCAVIDTGAGISEDRIAHIFDPFIQGDMSTSRQFGGSGLGLAICRRLVEAMGGEISAASQLERGATFTFKIPLDLQTTQTAAPPPPAAALGNDPAPLRLLVADDDRHMQILADIMLPRHGHAVTLVSDGAAALESARTGAFDCVILDMHMPVMDGFDAMRALKKDIDAGAIRRIPIIAVTADVLPERIRAFMDSGADAVIAKPVNWDALDAKIRELTKTPA